MLLIFDVEALEPRWHHIAGTPPPPPEAAASPRHAAVETAWDCLQPGMGLAFPAPTTFPVFSRLLQQSAVAVTPLTGRSNAAATTATLGDELNAASQRDGVPGETTSQRWRERQRRWKWQTIEGKPGKERRAQRKPKPAGCNRSGLLRGR